MRFKISFQGMPHSAAIETYAKKKVNKLSDLLKKDNDPHEIEFHLKSHPNNAHQEVVIHLRSDNLNLNAKSELPDMYFAIDDAVEIITQQVKKLREKMRDKSRKGMNEKRKFLA